MVCGMGGGGFGVGVARATLSDSRGDGVAWVRDERLDVLFKGIALCLRGLAGDGRVVRLRLRCPPHQDESEENSPNEEEEHEPPRGFLEKFRPDFARVHLSSSRWPSTRTTRTFHLLSGARLLRPPVPLPVIAKNAGVVDFGGITPDASARDCV